MAPFRFGVQLSKAPAGADWRDLARKLEDLGYSTLFIPDHFGDQWGPLVALTAAAEATSRLKVGSLVLDNDFRHPVVLAKECATLDLISEGRLEVGIGAGWQKTDYDESGIVYDSPGTRVSRLEEAVQIMKALWASDSVSFDGEHYKITAAAGAPVPHTPGGPPLIIGGGSPRVLRLAVRYADIIGVNPSLVSGKIDAATIAGTSPAAYAERIEWIRQAAGERFDSLELQSLVFLAQIGRPQAVIAEEMSGLFGFPPEEVAASATVLIGTEDEIVETLQRRREELGFSYWVLHEGEIESFAPVVARLAGT
ncbi:MAG TPA: TIGR03621 family F420-dependent LLM class oxidoreductase [Acidimicrobiales bacterium]|jgi:probable F420-dependent oxidoreductase|nr:TIGR03621 family F420-dependent LLM class oxidoreductase [Acidimicrobiales bacterium]